MSDAAEALEKSKMSRLINWVVSTRLWRSIVRHGNPDNDLDRMQAVFTNFFLHILPARVHVHTLRPTATLGLGVIALFLFFILIITGVLLMFYYVPSVDRAYNDMKDLQFVVSYGVILRNMHRWAAHGMVAAVFVHMCRVFYTGSYKPPREFNWVLGVVLWVLTMFLSFTGYLLPWDQLAFWAITVGSSIAAYPPLMGDTIRFMLLGGQEVGQGALLRFYVLHVAILPIVLSMVLAVHLWRVRKDGGLARPRQDGSEEAQPTTAVGSGDWDTGKTYGLMALARGVTPVVGTQAPEEEVTAWPHLTFRLLVIFVATVTATTAISLLFDAPLEELANPTHPPNPSKAPWYFLGLQELVSYSALVGGVIVPGLAVLGLMLIPYIDYSPEAEGVWFTSDRGRALAWKSGLAGALSVPILMVLNAQFGLRILWAKAPQIMVDIVNPATFLLLGMALFSSAVVRRTGSRRLGAIALFSSFLGALIVLTIIGTFFRGANWAFILPWEQTGTGH